MQNGRECAEVREDGSSGIVSRELIERYLDGMDDITLLGQDRERFITTAIVYQLNPFKREIHAKITKEDDAERVQFIVGYEVYIKKAERTGLLDGWKAWIEGTGDSLKAVVKIQRKDWKNPFIHEVYWVEAVQRKPDGTVYEFWERMPRFQLKKVAISQGFRLCFSDEIGGIPYDGSELPIQEASTANRQEAVKKPAPIKSEPGQLSSVPTGRTPVSQAESIHLLAMKNKDLLSDQHLEWIENQLRTEKTEAQLRGLLKHLQETIDAGGDKPPQDSGSKKQRDYPQQTAKARKPRLPVNYARPPVQKQEAPIF